jgi:hypothetical protein
MAHLSGTINELWLVAEGTLRYRSKQESKVVPLHTMKQHWRSRIAPTHS